jgi:hypothetical protein
VPVMHCYALTLAVALAPIGGRPGHIRPERIPALGAI